MIFGRLGLEVRVGTGHVGAQEMGLGPSCFHTVRTVPSLTPTLAGRARAVQRVTSFGGSTFSLRWRILALIAGVSR
jgi:hypothetical protein